MGGPGALASHSVPQFIYIIGIIKVPASKGGWEGRMSEEMEKSDNRISHIMCRFQVMGILPVIITRS